MIITLACEKGFRDGLRRRPADPRDPNRSFARGGVAFANRFTSELQHRLEKAMAALPDRKLSGVHADGNAAGTRRMIIAR